MRSSCTATGGRFALIPLVVAALLGLAGPAASQPPGGGGVGAFVSSNTGANPFVGLNVNQFLGANTFYANGYTGTQAIVANIEAGLVWNGHETLTNVNTYITGPGTVGAVSGVSAAYDRHATWVGQAIAGRPVGGAEYQRGIAYGATLWSGGIATSWNLTAGQYALNFNFNTYNAFYQPYVTATRTGVGGKTADVVNSSWGFGGDSTGRSAFTVGIDALARDTGKLFVFSAGNSGSGANTVGGPATGYNVLSVAAVGADTDARPYNAVSSFSSRGPQDVFIPTTPTGTTGTTVSGGRIRVDVAAPGQNLTLAYYGGATGGNAGNAPNGAPNFYSFNTAGTSFAAPTVAGGAALMVDVGRQLALPNATDGRVLKAVLMNAADKTAGWDNGQAVGGDGVVRTTQALDPAVGTGRMNLAAAYRYYADPASTRGGTGAAAGGTVTVAGRGYDFATATHAGTPADSTTGYALAPVAPADGSTLSVTLTWFADRRVSSFDNPSGFADQKLANLDLEVWSLVGGAFTSKVAESVSPYNNAEHLYLTGLAAGQYGFRVVYAGDVWNFTGDPTEGYAVAWEFVPAPEPAGLLGLAAVVLVVRRVRVV